MPDYFDICGTRIPFSSIKDFRIINVEFVFRPVFRECKRTMLSAISGKKYEFSHMEPYAAIVGQQGQKSALGEYKAKDFKEALGKDLSGAIIYTIADKLKLKAFKRQKYQCLNLAGRAFTTYLNDIPAKMIWTDGRIAEVYKEDPLYAILNELTMPGVEYVTALIVKADEIFCFYGNGIQLPDTTSAYERLKQEQQVYLTENHPKRLNENKRSSPTLPFLRFIERSSPNSTKILTMMRHSSTLSGRKGIATHRYQNSLACALTTLWKWQRNSAGSKPHPNPSPSGTVPSGVVPVFLSLWGTEIIYGNFS